MGIIARVHVCSECFEPWARQHKATCSHADETHWYADGEDMDFVPLAAYRGAVSENEQLRRQLEGAVEAARTLGSAWRANDDEAISRALVALEDACGLAEQGGQ